MFTCPKNDLKFHTFCECLHSIPLPSPSILLILLSSHIHSQYLLLTVTTNSSSSCSIFFQFFSLFFGKLIRFEWRSENICSHTQRKERRRAMRKKIGRKFIHSARLCIHNFSNRLCWAEIFSFFSRHLILQT